MTDTDIPSSDYFSRQIEPLGVMVVTDLTKLGRWDVKRLFESVIPEAVREKRWPEFNKTGGSRLKLIEVINIYQEETGMDIS